MIQGLRRLVRMLGFHGALGLAQAVLFSAYLYFLGPSWDSIRLIPGVILALGLFVSASASWGTYQRSRAVPRFQEVVGPLVSSRSEFALLLRSFGYDGEVLLMTGGADGRIGRWVDGRIGRWAGSLTLEQVISRTVRDTLGLDTYAVVDDALPYAPPGPVYLRATHTEWKVPVRALIRRAHTIFILLPPGQELRPSLAWEVAEIVRARRQDRVIIVMPPSMRGVHVDPVVLARGAAVMTALLQQRPLAEVTPEEVRAAVQGFPQQDVVLIGVADDPGGALLWMLQPGPPRRSWQRGRQWLSDAAIRQGVRQVLESKEQAWRGRAFEGRYPWRPGDPRAPGPARGTGAAALRKEGQR